LPYVLLSQFALCFTRTVCLMFYSHSLPYVLLAQFALCFTRTKGVNVFEVGADEDTNILYIYRQTQ
jgi:hypothetical protein